MNTAVQPSLLSKFEIAFGAEWTADPADMPDEHGDPYLISGIRTELQAIVAHPQIRRRAPKVVVHITILPRADPRLFVYANNRYPWEYVIAIHFGTVPAIRSALASPGVLAGKLDLPSLRRLHQPDFERLAIHVVLSALAYHELAHVFRYHTQYICDKRQEGADAERAALGSCEADADKWSSFMLAGDIRLHAEAIVSALRIHPLAVEPVTQELLTLTSACLYCWYAFYNRQSVPPPTLYPHPIIRALRMAIGAADNIDRESPDPRIALSRLSAVLVGASIAEAAVADSSDSPQRKYDLASELEAFEDTFTSTLATLDIELTNYVRGGNADAL